ncbi:glycoside hydrolase family 17 protein [Apiospora kogelbergensis]|uniref:glycoside hydrolase family 17 protein n=1 Tax=Apiospora kogelbergensis TaxID=1337665 RepID=UPI003130D91F
MRFAASVLALAASANAACVARHPPVNGTSAYPVKGSSSYPVAAHNAIVGSSDSSVKAVSSSASAPAAAATSAAAQASPSPASGTSKIASVPVKNKLAAASNIKGFNYGAFFMNQQAKVQNDFAYEFNKAKNLPGTNGWSSARLYSMVQWNTANDVIQAIPAAIDTQTTLLLGMWISGGPQAIDNEIAALKKAIDQYGSRFTDLVVGLSVGSEDLYRQGAGEIGTTGDYLIQCINKVREAIRGTPLEGVQIGHVDTYDSFVGQQAVIENIDWLGFDGYPFWEKNNPNSIDNAHARFYEGLDKTKALAMGKPVYVTETGWPVVGKQQGAAVASAENARRYWKDIACSLVASGVNLWWYDLQESQYGQAEPDFGIFPAGDLGQLQPSYDLSC